MTDEKKKVEAEEEPNLKKKYIRKKDTATKTVTAAPKEEMPEKEKDFEAEVAKEAKKAITMSDLPEPEKLPPLTKKEIEAIIDKEQKAFITTNAYKPRKETIIREKLKKAGIITTGDL